MKPIYFIVPMVLGGVLGVVGMTMEAWAPHLQWHLKIPGLLLIFAPVAIGELIVTSQRAAYEAKRRERNRDES